MEESLKISVSGDNKTIVLTPDTLINTVGFLDKYLCNTIAESLKSFDLIKNTEWKPKSNNTNNGKKKQYFQSDKIPTKEWV